MKIVCVRCEEQFPTQWDIKECPMCGYTILMPLEAYDKMLIQIFENDKEFNNKGVEL